MNVHEQKTFVEKTTMSMLPDECLHLIFLQLPVLERIKLRKVCRRWKRVSDDCWRKVRYLSVFHYEHDDKTDYLTGNSEKICVHSSNERFTIGFVERCAPHITVLHASSIFQNVSVLPAMNLCCNLKELSIAVKSKADDTHLANVLTRNRQIEDFSVDVQNDDYQCLKYLCTDFLRELSVLLDVPSSNKSFGAIVTEKIRRSSLLTHLEIQYVGSDEMFEAISEKINLVCLNVGCVDADYPDLSVDGINKISKLSNLKVITLHVPEGVITDTCLVNLGKHCKNLRAIYLKPCDQVTDEGLRALTFLPKLKTLNIFYAPLVTDTYLMYFGGIEHLTIMIADIKDDGVIELLGKNSCLQALELPGTSVSVETVKAAVEVVKKRTNNVSLYLCLANDVDLSELQDPLPQNLSIDTM